MIVFHNSTQALRHRAIVHQDHLIGNFVSFLLEIHIVEVDRRLAQRTRLR